MDVKSERPSFLIYKSFYGSIKHLTDENLGKLFRAMFEYHNDRVLKLEPEIQMALNFIKNQFELDQRKWEKKVAAQMANGKKGGRPKCSGAIDSVEEKPNQTHGYFKNPTKPKKAEKEKVNIDIKIENPRRVAGKEIQNIGNKED